MSRSHTPQLGGRAWEHAGGPPVTVRQQVGLLGAAAILVTSDLTQRAAWHLGRPLRRPAAVDLERWRPPDTQAAGDATALLSEVASPEMVGHSLRSYWFSAVMCELTGARSQVDAEALYVAAVLHDLGLFMIERPAHEHCFSVASAREARRIATSAGWDMARQDRMAAAITANINGIVPAERFGLEAHIFTLGGLVEVLAQEYRIHPDNLATILARYPRDGFVADSLPLVKVETDRNPRCRFACLNPLFGLMVANLRFSAERVSAA